LASLRLSGLAFPRFRSRRKARQPIHSAFCAGLADDDPPFRFTFHDTSVCHAIGSLEIAKVNMPVAVLIWLVIIPMLIKIDFAALG
jgi:hypothetical protein